MDPEPTSPDPTSATEVETSRRRLQGAVGERYRVLEPIGRGGFAEVFRGHDPALDRDVAIKVLRPDLTVSAELLERFQREARSIASLRHPNVVEVYQVGEVDGVAFYVMPLVRGETLAARLERDGRLELAEAVRILAETASGLGAAHRAGLVHRDVKPENLLLEGEEGRVVITDFGIAKASGGEETALTGTGMFVGTPQYVSPEQAAGDEVDHRSDLYSLGVLGYRMVTGRLPFEAEKVQHLLVAHLTQEPEPVRSHRPDCDERLSRVIERCLSKAPEQRFGSALEVTEILLDRDREADEVPASDEAPRPSEVAARRDPLPSFRRGGLLALAAVAAAVAFDVAVTGSPAFALAVGLAAAAYLAAGYQEVRRAGYGLRRILTGGPPDRPLPRPATEARHFGRHVGKVREARTARLSVVRLFNRLSRVERARFPDLLPAVDACVTEVKRGARRLAALESRAAERRDDAEGRASASATPWTPDGVLDAELQEAHERAAAELDRCVDALAQVRHWLARSGGADSEAVHDQLAEAVERAKEAVRHRHA